MVDVRINITLSQCRRGQHLSKNAPIKIASKRVARNVMEGGYKERMSNPKRPKFLRKVKLKYVFNTIRTRHQIV